MLSPLTLSAALPATLAVLAAVPGAPQDEGERKKFEPAVQLPEDFVRYARVPEGGIQPRVEAVEGATIVLYFKGDATQGDLYLTRSRDEARTFGPSLRLNAAPVLTQEAGHSGALDAGPDGLAHVVWVAGGETRTLQYAREQAEGELGPVQDLGAPARLALSPAVAVDAEGTVRVFFAAEDTQALEGETPGLRIWMRTSRAGGEFDAPVAIDQRIDGVSEDSGIAAHVDRVSATIYLLYLTAGRRGGAEVRLLSSANGATKFVSKVLELATRHDAPPRARPTLSQEIASERTKQNPVSIASWDTYGRVFWGAIDAVSHKLVGGIPITTRGEAKARRLRSVGLASGSEYLLAWLEHPVGDRSQPLRVGWQIWFVDGLTPLGWGQAGEPAGASFPAVIANRERGFTILY